MVKTINLQRLSLVLIVASALLYWPGLEGPLLFDDKPALTANKAVQISGSSADEWRVAAFSSNSGPLRRPVSMLSFAANHVVMGDFSPFGLKTTNLFIHVAIAVLLYFFFRSILCALEVGPDDQIRSLLALAGAAIWLLHPLNVSTVLYAVQRMAQLASFFALAGMLIFLRYRQRWAREGGSIGEVLAALLWILIFTALSALSKENGALLPWLIVVLEVCIFRGVWAKRPNMYLKSAAWVALALPVCLVVFIYFFSPEWILKGYGGREFTLEQRVLTQVRLMWRYVGWIVFPNIADMGFQHDDIPLSTGLLSPGTTLLSISAWLALLLGAFTLRRRYPLILLALLFFLVGHSMESTIIPLEMVYEHRNYLPGTLVCLLVACGLILPAHNSRRIDLRYPLFGFLAIISMLLFLRVHAWSDELTLSRINVARHPESSRSNYFYANALLRNYRRAEQRGLSETERMESLLLSRHYFERMYQTNNRDVAALVMLFYLDLQFFPDLEKRVDWFGKLENLLAVRTLQPSDWNSLAMLFELLSSQGSAVSEQKVIDLLDQLTDRYPSSIAIMRYRYQYLAATGKRGPELIDQLLQAHVYAPDDPVINSYLLYEKSKVNDLAGIYEISRNWMLHDSQRQSLHIIKSIFGDAKEKVGSSHD